MKNFFYFFFNRKNYSFSLEVKRKKIQKELSLKRLREERHKLLQEKNRIILEEKEKNQISTKEFLENEIKNEFIVTL